MKEEDITPLEFVYKSTELMRTADARKIRIKSSKDIKGLASDMLLVVEALAVDLKKFLDKGMQEPAKRVRRGTKALYTLGTEFRVRSVKIKKYGKIG
jgi:hypothetical protein